MLPPLRRGSITANTSFPRLTEHSVEVLRKAYSFKGRQLTSLSQDATVCACTMDGRLRGHWGALLALGIFAAMRLTSAQIAGPPLVGDSTPWGYYSRRA